MRTLGVEEEFLLVTPEGEPQAVAGAVLRAAALDAIRDAPEVPDGEPGGELEKEFKQEQVEISTRPRESLAELLEEVRTGRAVADEYAQRAGARVAALATPPQAVDSTVLANRRANRIRTEFGQTAREQLTCGCHVHVAVEDDEEGVRVLDHLRSWTPVLLALSANSPWWQGEETGYASFRSQVWGRWPSAGPTSAFGDAAGYRALVDGLLQTGAVLDRGMLYFDARLSDRYPTVEVRVADVCLDAADAVLQAALVRGLADTATRSGAAAADPPRVELVRAATWRAARWPGGRARQPRVVGAAARGRGGRRARRPRARRAGRQRRPGVGRGPGGTRPRARQRRGAAAGVARGRRRRRGGRPPSRRPDERRVLTRQQIRAASAPLSRR